MTNAFIPGFDDLTLADFEREGFAAVAGAVEFVAAEEFSGVVDVDYFTGFWFVAVSVGCDFASYSHFDFLNNDYYWL